MEDAPSEESHTIRLVLQDRTAELTASSRIECRGWMQVLKHITADEDFLQRRKRVGTLSVAVLKISGSTKGKAKPKYEKRWGVLDAASLRLFASDQDVGTEKGLKEKIPITTAVKVIEPAPWADGEEIDPTDPMSSRFSLLVGGKQYDLEGAGCVRVSLASALFLHRFRAFVRSTTSGGCRVQSLTSKSVLPSSVAEVKGLHVRSLTMLVLVAVQVP